MREYAVIYERGPTNWSAYVPDLSRCIFAGKTRADINTLTYNVLDL